MAYSGIAGSGSFFFFDFFSFGGGSTFVSAPSSGCDSRLAFFTFLESVVEPFFFVFF
jgi:hypothetical protein